MCLILLWNVGYEPDRLLIDCHSKQRQMLEYGFKDLWIDVEVIAAHMLKMPMICTLPQ